MLNLIFLYGKSFILKIFNHVRVEAKGVPIIINNLVPHTTSLRVLQLVPARLVTITRNTELPFMPHIFRLRVRSRASNRSSKGIGTCATTCTIVTTTLAVFILAKGDPEKDDEDY